MNGFISYAHEDRRLFQEFRKHLSAVEREFEVTFWCDERIDVGMRWEQEILSKIEAADLFLLLISPSFWASEYIWGKEKPAIEARDAASDRVLVLPVVLTTCSWNLIAGKWQATPAENGKIKPIADWKPQRHGHHYAAMAIANSIRTFKAQFMTTGGPP